MTSKSFLVIIMLMASSMVLTRVEAYAIIDLNPNSATPVSNEEARDASSQEGVVAVEVSSKQRGHLLALVPVSFPVKVVARADGRLEIDYPWYSFMTFSPRVELETKLRVAVNNAKSSAFLGSVRAEGESADPKFTRAEAEAVAKGLASVLAEHGED